ncbi:MAG: hypothetical protein CAF45_015385 [Nitrospira sp. CG24E]|nr:MAG: hypothetical protein CAF45_015385 [Nitrospira sp. CG24E]
MGEFDAATLQKCLFVNRLLVQSSDIAMVYPDSNFIDEQGALLKVHNGKPMAVEDILCWSWHISQPIVFLRRELIDQVGMMKADLHYEWTYDLWIWVTTCYQIQYPPGVIANERHYPSSKTVIAPELGLKGRLQTLNSFSLAIILQRFMRSKRWR